jgi:uncharacterized protein YkwD
MWYLLLLLINPDPLLVYANQERTHDLVYSECLAEFSYERARDMSLNGYFSHYHDGKKMLVGLRGKCGKFNLIGENLSKGFNSYGEVHEAFMASPTHRENVVEERFDLFGSGCFNNICVEVFAEI